MLALTMAFQEWWRKSPKGYGSEAEVRAAWRAQCAKEYAAMKADPH